MITLLHSILLGIF